VTDASDPEFATFCHISEYGEAGYRNLHRLLAFSAPLNLWAPSSLLVRHSSRISSTDFIRYVDEGLIRIHAREEWITDRTRRDGHPWEGAAWNAEIDGALLAIARQDEREPASARRVVIAPPEEGMDRAAAYLDANPDQVTRWHRIFNSATAHTKLPAGTREAAERARDRGPDAVAGAILRDAFNHGLAIRGTGSDVPLLLSSADRQFLKLLEESWAPARPQPKRAEPMMFSELAGQLIEVLRHLDIHRGPRDIDSFLRGKGRRYLVTWLHDICLRYRELDPRHVDGIIIRELRSQLDRGTFAKPVREALTHPVTTSGGVVGFVLAAVECVQDPSNQLALTGMAAAAVGVAGGLAKQFGITPGSYDGPQWPFLYAYRSLARPRQLRTLRHVMSEFR
jgi:hypothetical protein